MVLVVGSFISCKKNEATPTKLSTNEMAQRLYTQKDFVDFAGSFAKNFKYLADYYQTPSILNNKETFIQTLRNAGDDETLVEAAHANFGLSLNEIIIRKNNLNNDILHLYNTQPELLNYTEDEFWSIIKQSILLLKQSSSSNAVQSFSSGISGKAIAIDEVWDCLVRAVGLGAAGILTIAGIHALAKKGIQQAVISVAAFMAKRAGFIGLGIMVLDFSSCMYRASYD